MALPTTGDKVQVRARKGLRVQEHSGIFGRFMSDEAWIERTWDEWLHRRLADGSIEIKAEETVSIAPPESPASADKIKKQ